LVDPQNKFVYVTSNVEEVTGGGRSTIWAFTFSGSGVLTPLVTPFFDGGPAGGGADDGGGADGIAISAGTFAAP
jgi:hypothetical protein